MKQYIAINLNDFHQNQKGNNAQTYCQMIFIGAKNIKGAKTQMSLWYPEAAWAIILKATLDKHIVYKD